MKFSMLFTFLIFILPVIITDSAHAYIDGGTIGQIFQYGYLLVYAALGGLLLVLRWLKSFTKKIIPGKEEKP